MTQCVIEGISHDGQGVGRIEGLAVFVPGTLPGEIVDIDITQRKKNFARGRLNSIVEPVVERVEPPCPYYWQCGGCAYQHASYELQLGLKTRVVQQTLQRVGKIDAPVNPCLPSPQVWGYRNKVTWHGALGREGWHMGYYRDGIHDILPVKNCLLISETMQQVSNRLAEQLENQLQPLSNMELTVRESSYNGGLMAVLSGLALSQSEEMVRLYNGPDLAIIHCGGPDCVALQGAYGLQERLADTAFTISPRSFFQVNRGQAEQLLQIIKEWLSLEGSEHILDAYSGVGSLALNLASSARKVMGIESFKHAVKDAKANARLNGYRNCRFLTGLTEAVLPTLTNRFDAVILDPPRSGCNPKVVQSVARLKIPQVIYVSCEPSTLARDLAHFVAVGYQVKEIQPLDMFPWTRHVECVIMMTYCGRKDK